MKKHTQFTKDFNVQQVVAKEFSVSRNQQNGSPAYAEVNNNKRML